MFRRKQRQVEDLGMQAEESVERLLIRRLNRLLDVRRFVAGWLALMVLLVIVLLGQFRALNRNFQSMQPIPGGIYSEGMMGTFTNANPLYASSQVDATVSRLVFAGLLQYDQSNKLVGDLAESWSVSEDNKTYTVLLKQNLVWHDGKPLTPEDVVYTFQVAQNPDAKSPLFRSWNGIKVSAKDTHSVQFTLPSPFAPFPHSLTTGIVPKHLLVDVPMTELRSAQFNTTKPVGAGPFSWDTVELVGPGEREGEQRIGLIPFAAYHGGKPQLSIFVVRTYNDQDKMLADFSDKTITAIVGLDRLPDELANSKEVIVYNPTLTAQVVAFFRTDSDLLNDAKTRQGLVRSINQPDVLGALSYPAVRAHGPLLKGQLGYNATLTQLGFDKEAANKLLDEAGWKKATNGMRTKDNKNLSLKLITQATPDFTHISTELQKAWKEVGVEVNVTLVDEEEIQTLARDRNYDIMLYGISIGVDPDVFAYWHSTQADPRSGSRLNFSNYKSDTADQALEAGRSRTDPALRAAKYEPFLASWRNDAPALALYQPQFLYVTNSPVFGFNQQEINVSADRFANIHNWMIQQALRPKP